jgi:hypothetical protein
MTNTVGMFCCKILDVFYVIFVRYQYGTILYQKKFDLYKNVKKTAHQVKLLLNTPKLHITKLKISKVQYRSVSFWGKNIKRGKRKKQSSKEKEGRQGKRGY